MGDQLRQWNFHDFQTVEAHKSKQCLAMAPCGPSVLAYGVLRRQCLERLVVYPLAHMSDPLYKEDKFPKLSKLKHRIGA
jgi:hypothetical protein